MMEEEYTGETEMRDLLISWNVPTTILANFINNHIRVDHLPVLDDKILADLCPVLGIRLDIKKKIQEYADANATTETQSTVTLFDSEVDSPSQEIDYPVIILPARSDLDQPSTSKNFVLSSHERNVQNALKPDITDFDLKTLLMTSPLGKSVLNFYNASGKLDTTRRNRLTDVIARQIYTQAVNYKITYDDYNALAAKIITLFPTENIGTYFVRPIGKYSSPTGKATFAKGKLIDKIRNIIYKSEIRKRKRISNEIETDEKENQTCSEEDILFLKYNTDPWEEVLVKWENTFDARQQGTYTTVTDFLKDWPILHDLRSESLINKDFNRLYPDRDLNFIKSWRKVFNKIRSLKKDSLSDVHAKILNESLGDLDDNVSDKSLATELILFAYLVPPKGRIDRKWKFSTAESIEGLILHVKNVGDIETCILSQKEKAKKQKATVQPYVLVQGEQLDHLNSIFLIVDDVKYTFKSCTKAFDTLFKLYHVFHCSYPKPSEHLYLIIQRCIYNIETKYDKIPPYIVDIINS